MATYMEISLQQNFMLKWSLKPVWVHFGGSHVNVLLNKNRCSKVNHYLEHLQRVFRLISYVECSPALDRSVRIAPTMKLLSVVLQTWPFPIKCQNFCFFPPFFYFLNFFFKFLPLPEIYSFCFFSFLNNFDFNFSVQQFLLLKVVLSARIKVATVKDSKSFNLRLWSCKIK